MQIELQNVKKVYPVTGGEVVALDNISLKIRKGDIFGIIGLSGAGKSTLIRCINRLDTPTEGKILIDGQNVPDMNKQQLRQMRRKVSMIFQQFNVLMQHTPHSCPAVSASASPSPAPSPVTPKCCSATKQPAPLTP